MRRRCVPSQERVHETTCFRDRYGARAGRHGHPQRRTGPGRGFGPADGRRAQGHRAQEHRADARHGPDRRRPDRCEEPERLVRGDRLRRPLEDRQPRHHLHADLRRWRVVHAVLHRHRPERLERALSRHRREQQPAKRAFRRRRLQVDRRGRDVEARRPGDVRAHRQDPDRPAQHERRLRGLAGPALVAGRRTRTLQDHRRRRHLVRHPDHQPGHRHQRHRVRSEEPGHHLRLGLPAPARRRADDRRRARGRHLQDHQRRQDVDEADEGPAHGRHGPRRVRRRRPQDAGHAVRHRRRQARGIGLLPIG